MNFESALRFILTVHPRISARQAVAYAETLVGEFDAQRRAVRMEMRVSHEWSHSALVSMAQNSTVVMNHVKMGQKIQAIKELRELTRNPEDSTDVAGLAITKRAIEDAYVWGRHHIS